MVGRVAQIWRYPVKSMLGEQLGTAELTPLGLRGDRRYALRDVIAGTVLSGKRVAEMFTMRASTTPDGVTVELPDGTVVEAGTADAGTQVSRVVGRSVSFAEPQPGPPQAMESVGDGRSHEGEPTTFRGMPATFFDSAPLHVLTDATLAHLAELAPSTRFDPRRFRPNLYLETGLPPGFIEETWVGRELQVGAAIVAVGKPCSRCVMTTLPQDDLPKDREVLRTLAQHNDVNAGVLATIVAPGTVTVGDPVSLR